MATIIETVRGFIAGDPPSTVPDGYHWCPSCEGDGLGYDDDGELTICFECSGSCTLQCDDERCDEHRDLFIL